MVDDELWDPVEVAKARISNALGRFYDRMVDDAPQHAQRPPKRRKKKSGHPTESEEQKLFAAWLRARGVVFDISLNGTWAGNLGARFWAAARAQGALRGSPDIKIFTPHPTDRSVRVYVEMKAVDGKKPPQHQLDIHDELRGYGDIVLVPYGHQEAIDMMENLGY